MAAPSAQLDLQLTHRAIRSSRVLRLRFEANSYEQIGEALGCSAEAARVRYRRACRRLEAECRKLAPASWRGPLNE